MFVNIHYCVRTYLLYGTAYSPTAVGNIYILYIHIHTFPAHTYICIQVYIYIYVYVYAYMYIGGWGGGGDWVVVSCVPACMRAV